jgi:YrbI family 3-deoxy-D-manno-octulosonate 8-phosphate phosphatase
MEYPIKYMVTDCDGVLTDGKYYYSNKGKHITFHVHDSVAIHLLKELGIKVFIVSSTGLPGIVSRIAKEWDIDFYHAKPFQKLAVVKKYADINQTAYIGDTIDDIPVLQTAKISFVPHNTAVEISCFANNILRIKGGEGCLLEALLILQSKHMIPNIDSYIGYQIPRYKTVVGGKF